VDPVSNPYTPGSGLSPAELAGREELRQAARVAIERVRRGAPFRNLLLVGLRGVGKTVLLDQMRLDAAASGIPTVRLEASGGRSLPSLLAPELRLALLHLSRNEASKEASIRALRALTGFATALKSSYLDIEVGLDHEPESGLADSGVLQQDLPSLLEAVGTAARHSQTALVLFFDELQFVRADERTALISALHRCAQRGLPVALVGAGLPQLRGQVAETEPYVDRLFELLELGPLSTEAAVQALIKPAASLNVQFEEAAVTHLLAATQCHPYFLQELAKQAWDVALQSPITLQDTRTAAHFALAALDEKFFRVRFERLTPTEKKYIRAMAELGSGSHRSGEIAAVLNRPVTSVGPARSQLIAKGMIWSPGHGDTAFAVPRFDEFLRRTWPDNAWRQ
jgi:AAA ATPase domain